MKVYTWTELRGIIDRELDLEDETFVSDDEYYDYVNQAIDEAEAIIHNLYEGYFKKDDDITLVDGTASYDMPTDIYANKLLLIQYNNGSIKYKIERIKNIEKAITVNSDFYMYDIENANATDGPKIVLYPPAKEDGQYIKVWYLRNAGRVTTGTDPIDIPEFYPFVKQYVKYMIMEKEAHPLLQNAKQDLNRQEQRMRQTLATMLPDEDEVLDPDLSFYEEFN